MPQPSLRPPVYIALALTVALTTFGATSNAEQTEAQANLRGGLNGAAIVATGAMASYVLVNRKNPSHS